MKMKIGLLFIISIFGVTLLQHGCGNANKANQSSVNNQNLAVVLASPTPTAISSPNQNTTNNGISAEEDRKLNSFRERCQHAPIGKAKVTQITGTAPLKVTFDGSASYDPDGTKIVKWEWHFGNGQSGEGKKITYIYEKPGRYGIILNVTDSQGQKTFDCSDGGTDINIVVTDNKNTNENTIQKEN